jgi:DNA topoisomerase-1
VAEAKRNVDGVVRKVAEQLGNTPAICRKSYIDDAVLETYSRRADIHECGSGRDGLKRNELALLALLRENAPEC